MPELPPKPPLDAPPEAVEAWLDAEEAQTEAYLRQRGEQPAAIEAVVGALRRKRLERGQRLRGSPQPAGEALREAGSPAGGNRDLAELRNAMALFRPDWPEPDMAVAAKARAAAGHVPVREILAHLGELHRRGLRPDVSWDWFAGVLRKRFGRPAKAAKRGSARAVAVAAGD